jgi:hypothetical protein
VTQPPFNLADLPSHPDVLRFHATRGTSIDAYSGLEQSLCAALALFGEMPPDVAGLIFFRMVNTRSRLSVLEKLALRKYGTKYKKFWASASKRVEELDRTRNWIVHWAVVHEIRDDKVSPCLMQPNFHDADFGGEKVDTHDLEAFIAKANFMNRLINMLISFERVPQLLGAQAQAWQEIFQQACTYPPSCTHPLAQK